MPANMNKPYRNGGGSKKKMKRKKRKYGTGGTAKPMEYGNGGAYGRRMARMGTGMSMPNDVMNLVRAAKGKQMKGAMKLFNALAKKLGKKVR